LIPVLRLFLDANALFVAGYSRTSPVHDLLALGRAGACELVASGYAIEEARRNLEAKGPVGAVDALSAALADVTLVAEARAPASEVAASAALADSADVPILATAIQCRADILATGDRRAFGRHFRTRLIGVEVLVLRDALRRVLGMPLNDPLP
jgi:predicted nucleic acid-binding protein